MTERTFASACTVAIFGGRLRKGVAITELETRSGVPDLVLVSGIASCAALSRIDAGVVTNGRASAAALLSRFRPHTVGYLLKWSGLDKARLRKVLFELETAGVAEKTETGSWVLAQDFDVTQLRIEVIEYKLRDWRKALAQACRYRSLADRVTVVMPAERASALRKCADLFRMYGIGLAVYSIADDEFRYLSKAKKCGPLCKSARMDAIGRVASAVGAGTLEASFL